MNHGLFAEFNIVSLRYTVFAGNVAAAGIDLVGLQPRVGVLVGTVLPGSLAVVGTDRHVALLPVDVVRWLRHIWEPGDQGKKRKRKHRLTCNSWLGHNG